MQINFVVVHLLPFNFLLIPFIFAVRANAIFISWRVQNVLIDWLIDPFFPFPGSSHPTPHKIPWIHMIKKSHL